MKFKIRFKCDLCGEIYYNHITAKSRKDATRYKRIFKENNGFIHRLEGSKCIYKGCFTLDNNTITKFKLIDDKYVNNNCRECCSDCSSYCGADCPLDIEGTCDRCEFRGGVIKN